MTDTLVEIICRECQQTFKGEQHHAVCPTCVEQYMSDHYDEEDDDFEEEDDFDCGLMADGQCTMAGSEDCDFSCPNRDSELFAGSKAWMKKHGSACFRCGQEFEDGQEPGQRRSCAKCQKTIDETTPG